MVQVWRGGGAGAKAVGVSVRVMGMGMERRAAPNRDVGVTPGPRDEVRRETAVSKCSYMQLWDGGSGGVARDGGSGGVGTAGGSGGVGTTVAGTTATRTWPKGQPSHVRAYVEMVVAPRHPIDRVWLDALVPIASDRVRTENAATTSSRRKRC
jgi:hypothetical protein